MEKSYIVKRKTRNNGCLSSKDSFPPFGVMYRLCGLIFPNGNNIILLSTNILIDYQKGQDTERSILKQKDKTPALPKQSVRGSPASPINGRKLKIEQRKKCSEFKLPGGKIHVFKQHNCDCPRNNSNWSLYV